MSQLSWIPKKTEAIPATTRGASGAGGGDTGARPVRRPGLGVAGALLRAAGALQPRQRCDGVTNTSRGEPAGSARGRPWPPRAPPGFEDRAKATGDAPVPTPPVANVDAKEFLQLCLGDSDSEVGEDETTGAEQEDEFALFARSELAEPAAVPVATPVAALVAAIPTTPTAALTAAPESAPASPVIVAGASTVCFSMDFSPEMAAQGSEDAASEDGEGYDIEDMFDFDPSRMAALLQQGADVAELTDHLEDAYVSALERRLSGAAPVQGLALHEEAAEEVAEEAAPALTGDISALMTPTTSPKAAGQIASVDEAASPSGPSAEDAQSRRRRSSQLRHRPSVLRREEEAMKMAELKSRKSLAHIQEAASLAKDNSTCELMEQRIQAAKLKAQRRHRQSLDKAVEVLEAAEVRDEKQVDSKLELIQQAMDKARQRHRRSVTEAVHKVVKEADAFSAQDGEGDEAATVQARIQAAISEAYARRCADSEWQQSPAGEWYGEASPAWQQEVSAEGWHGQQGFVAEGWYEGASCAEQAAWGQASYAEEAAWSMEQGQASYADQAAWSMNQGQASYAEQALQYDSWSGAAQHSSTWEKGTSDSCWWGASAEPGPMPLAWRCGSA